MKCISFLFRLQCFLHCHSLTSILLTLCLAAYPRAMIIYTPSAHTRCCRSNCACWQKMTQWPAAAVPLLCSVCAWTVVHMKTICPPACGKALCRVTHGDWQCTHYTEIRMYAFGGKIVSLHPGSSLLPILEYSLHCSTYNKCLQYDGEWLLQKEKITNWYFKG